MACQYVELDGVKLIAKDDKVLVVERRRGFEPKTREKWKKLSRNHGVMIDVGAYTGFYSILAAKNGAKSVIAIEPNPEAQARIYENCRENSVSHKITVAGFAAYDVTGKIKAFRGRANLSSAASLTSLEAKICNVITFRIDDLALDNVTAIKIDVEQSEIPVLKGARETIARCRPVVLIELLRDTSRADAFFLRLGYTRSNLDGAMFSYEPADCHGSPLGR